MSIRRLIALLIGILLVGLWWTESDLAYNIAQQRPILLGRYTLDKTIMLLIVSPAALAVMWALLKKPKEPKSSPNSRLFWFKTISLVISILLGVVLVDVMMRLLQRSYYVGTERLYHRQPNSRYEGVFEDKPEFAFSYPRRPGYWPKIHYNLTVDARGFRNAKAVDKADWVVLGDSFAEGSKVSDQQTWPFLLAQQSGQTIYNLGMSGGNPLTYIETLKKFGLSLKPKGVLYLLYEGNDFRDVNFSAQRLENPSVRSLWEVIYKASPLRQRLKMAVLHTFESVGAQRFKNDPAIFDPSHRLYAISWLPFEFPAGSGNFYTFDVKRLEQHWISETQFQRSSAATHTLALLEQTHRLCNQHNVRLVVVYAPDAPHILLDDICQSVPAAQLRAFLAVRKKNLPPAEELIKQLKEGVGVKERIVEEFCRENKIDFVSLTAVLQQKTRQGVKTYYTYDQHWTAEGHRVVAEFLADQLSIWLGPQSVVESAHGLIFNEFVARCGL